MKHITARAADRLLRSNIDYDTHRAACSLRNLDYENIAMSNGLTLSRMLSTFHEVDCQECKVVWDAALEGKNMIGHFAKKESK